jgi:hypothetical protein
VSPTHAFLTLSIISITAGVAAPRASVDQEPSVTVVCLHSSTEGASDKTRRAQAVELARAIRLKETLKVEGPADDVKSALARGPFPEYLPIAILGALPPVPDGFEMHFYLGDHTYLFSITDKLDPCHYAVFADHHGMIERKSLDFR